CGVQHGNVVAMPRASRKASAAPNKKIVKTYPYHDEQGNVLFECVRYEPKDFKQRRPVGGGKFEWNLKGVRKVLYRLPELLAADPNAPVFIPEGEKDVDNLVALGLIATCNPMGASKGARSKWDAAILEPLHGRIRIFLPDNDRVGKDHAVAGATLLSVQPGKSYILELPGLGEHGDVTDWLTQSADNGADALRAMLETLAEFVPPQPPEIIEQRVEKQEGDGVNAYTDTRNARRLVAKYGEQIRFDHTRGVWRMWDNKVWAQDETERIMRLSKDIVKDIHKELKAKYLEPKEYREELKEILATESTGRLKAMSANARSDVYATHKTWDPDPYLFNCGNGTIDLRTGELLSHRPERWQSKIGMAKYDPDAKCPKWDQFLLRIFDNDQELIDFVQRSVGLSMIGEVIEHVLYVMWGAGANGKSTFLNVIMEIFGDYARVAAPDLLMARDTPQHSTNIAELRGVRMVSTVETNQGSRLSEALVKMLTGGEVRNARFLFQDAFEY
ncbi:MAG: phage/plasmid primase, P4 family, partial [Ktedonobacterales bacterium]